MEQLLDVEEDESYGHQLAHRSRRHVSELRDLIRFSEFLL